MSKSITPISLSRIPTLEYPEFTNTFVRIIDQFNTEDLFIGDPITVLKGRVPQLEQLKVVNKKNPESETIQSLFTRRRDIITAMLGQTRKLVKAGLGAQATQLKLVAPLMESYWSNIRTFNEKTINARMKQMLEDVETISGLKPALTLLGLNLHVDELKTIESGLFSSKEIRRKSRSEMPKVDSRQIRSFVGEAITDVVNAIEIARKAHPEVDYAPMINEINELFISYQSDIKAHTTRNRNAANKAATAATAKPYSPAA